MPPARSPTRLTSSAGDGRWIHDSGSVRAVSTKRAIAGQGKGHDRGDDGQEPAGQRSDGEQGDGVGADHQQGEEVGVDGERGEGGVEQRRAGARPVDGPHQRPGGEGREEEQHRVGPELLRPLHDHGVQREQEGGHQAHPLVEEPLAQRGR